MALEEGYVLLKVGALDESCQDHPGLCVYDSLDDDDEQNGAYVHGFGLVWAVILSSGGVSTFMVFESF